MKLYLFLFREDPDGGSCDVRAVFAESFGEALKHVEGEVRSRRYSLCYCYECEVREGPSRWDREYVYVWGEWVTLDEFVTSPALQEMFYRQLMEARFRRRWEPKFGKVVERLAEKEPSS